MTPATRANAEAIAAFLNETKFSNARVGSIASMAGCPIRSTDEVHYMNEAAQAEYFEDRTYLTRKAANSVGTEPHCRQVTAALNAAAELGLITRNRAGRGPWRYSAVEVAS